LVKMVKLRPCMNKAK